MRHCFKNEWKGKSLYILISYYSYTVPPAEMLVSTSDKRVKVSVTA